MSYDQFYQDQINSTVARQSYAQYLQEQKWDYFITVTFRKRFTDSIKAHETVWETLSGLWTGRAFLAVERHRYPNNACHVHGLVKGIGGPERVIGRPSFDSFHLWHNLYVNHGRSMVEEVRSVEDVAAYCSKYVVKRLSEYGFYGQPVFWSNGT